MKPKPYLSMLVEVEPTLDERCAVCYDVECGTCQYFEEFMAEDDEPENT